MAIQEPLSDQEEQFYPIPALERASKPLMTVFAVLLIVASIWGMINQVSIWSRPVQLTEGYVGEVQERVEGGTCRYSVSFTVAESGQVMEIQLRNNSPVLEYLSKNHPPDVIALRYWKDNLMAFELYPLEYGVAPVKDPIPLSFVLVGSSILGLLLAGVLLFPEALDRFIYGVGRWSRRRKR